MTEVQLTRIIKQTLAARRAERNDWPKLVASILACVIAVGGIYTMFLQPSTLAEAAQDAEQEVEQHEAQLHTRVEKRLDRIEVKIDAVLAK